MNPTRAAHRGRQLAQKLMVDHCSITRQGRPVVDPMTGKETPGRTGVYLGPCRITNEQSFGHDEESAGATLAVERVTLHLPLGTATVAVNDRVEITGSFNPGLVGRKYRIAYLASTSFAMETKYTIEEVN